MSATETILAAIAKRRTLAFAYKDEIRTADPYILGYDDKGTLVLSAVQRTGRSGAGFRTYHVERLVGVRMTDRHFFGRDRDYNPGDPYFAQVLGKV